MDSRFTLFLIYVLISGLMISCSKNPDYTVDQGNGGENLYFNLDGFSDEENSSSKASLTNGEEHIIDNSMEAEVERSVINDEGVPFVGIARVNEELLSSNYKEKLNKGKIAAKVKMDKSIHYRILIFDNSDKFLTSIDATAGTTPVWNGANRNTKYKWKAYSYNTSDPITPVIPANPTNQNLSISYNSSQDFMYDAGIVETSNIPNANNKVNILFKRQRAAIQLVMSARGMFDKISDLSGLISGISRVNTGTFNLKDGSKILGSSDNTDITLKMSDFVNLLTSNDTIKVYTLYSLDDQSNIGSATSPYTFTYSSLTFTTDRVNSTRTYTTQNTGGMKFTFTKNFKPVLGRQYKIIIDLLATARNIPSTPANTVYWSYHNLYYNSTTKAYAFRHYNSNVYGDASRAQEYFNWRARFPGNNQSVDDVDPCTLVYPNGRWRMPTDGEFNTIRNIPTSGTNPPIRRNARSGDPVRYIDIYFENTPANFQPLSDVNGLPLLMYGYRNVGADTFTEYNTSTSGSSSVNFWTSTSQTADNARYFSISNNYTNSTSTMTISTQSANRDKKTGHNIRCVLNPSFNNLTYTPNIK